MWLSENMYVHIELRTSTPNNVGHNDINRGSLAANWNLRHTIISLERHTSIRLGGGGFAASEVVGRID